MVVSFLLSFFFYLNTLYYVFPKGLSGLGREEWWEFDFITND